MPSFSPDARAIVFNHYDTGSGHSLATMHFDQGSTTFSSLLDVVTDPTSYLGWPSVPPDGPFKVAVIGHEGNRYPLWLGGYSSQQDGAGVGNEVSPYAGIKAEIQSIDPSAQVDFYDGFQGGDVAGDGRLRIPERA